ncbi:hypothetical protein ACHQM5_025228 [Ranunculus cassubicifolius]
MVRSGIGKLTGNCPASKHVLSGEDELSYSMKESKKNEREGGVGWIPHPRTGIYYPKGGEWVMDDVPNGAASFEQTYWIRGEEGVDK